MLELLNGVRFNTTPAVCTYLLKIIYSYHPRTYYLKQGFSYTGVGNKRIKYARALWQIRIYSDTLYKY